MLASTNVFRNQYKKKPIPAGDWIDFRMIGVNVITWTISRSKVDVHLMESAKEVSRTTRGQLRIISYRSLAIRRQRNARKVHLLLPLPSSTANERNVRVHSAKLIWFRPSKGFKGQTATLKCWDSLAPPKKEAKSSLWISNHQRPPSLQSATSNEFTVKLTPIEGTRNC